MEGSPLTAWRVRCDRCEWVFVAQNETEARSLEASHQRDHEQKNIDAKIKVYELPWWRQFFEWMDDQE
jgi:hypothetical protein